MKKAYPLNEICSFLICSNIILVCDLAINEIEVYIVSAIWKSKVLLVAIAMESSTSGVAETVLSDSITISLHHF